MTDKLHTHFKIFSILWRKILLPLLPYGIIGYLGIFLIYPVWVMLKGAFSSANGFSFEYFTILISSPLVREACLNSLIIALATTILTLIISLPIAHIMTRYTFPGKEILNTLLLIPMIMPPFVGAIGIQQFFSKYGSLNCLLMELELLPHNMPIDWLGSGGLWGIILLQALHLYPILYLNLTATMANLDPSFREAAQNMGASGWKIFYGITLPLIIPGLFGGAFIVFIGSLADLGTPLIFNYTRCIPVQIFDGISDMNTNPIGFTLVIFILFLTSTLFITSRILLPHNLYETSSRGSHTGNFEIPAKKSQYIKFHIIFILIILTASIPNILVFIQSFSKEWFMSTLPAHWTTENYIFLGKYKLTLSCIRNSVFYSSLSGILDIILGISIAWYISRSKSKWGILLDALAMMPLILPGLVLAFGYMSAFDLNISWLNPRNNPTLLLIISYSVRRLPYMVRAAYAGFQQASISLQEASTNLGATPLRTFRKITLPLISGHLIGGFILTFCFAILEVSASLILATREYYYPITKLMWDLISRIDPQAPAYTCAMGVIGMILLVCSLWIASKLLGKKLGQVFRI